MLEYLYSNTMGQIVPRYTTSIPCILRSSARSVGFYYTHAFNPALAGSIRRETEELQPVLQQEGAVRRSGAVPAMRAVAPGMLLLHLPNARAASEHRADFEEAAFIGVSEKI